jgi:hypothetical protein
MGTKGLGAQEGLAYYSSVPGARTHSNLETAAAGWMMTTKNKLKRPETQRASWAAKIKCFSSSDRAILTTKYNIGLRRT